MNLKRTILSGTALVSIWAFAQPEDLNVRDPRLNEGQLFTLQYTPGDQHIVVRAAGKKAAILGKDRVIVSAREIPRDGEPIVLQVEANENTFKILDRIDLNSPIELDVEDLRTRNKETIRIEQRRP